MMQKAASNRLVDAYMAAKEVVLEKGFAAEIDWQEAVDFLSIHESDFLREGAWVILNSGMKETVVREKFPRISAAFGDWRDARLIVKNESKCRRAALRIFNHTGKVDAILSLAQRVATEGFVEVKSRIAAEGVSYLMSFDFVGPITCYHLAKNIGLDAVKPDRHLIRVAKAAGYQTPLELCRAIATRTGDKISVVDIVIWRYSSLYSSGVTDGQFTDSAAMEYIP